MATKTITLTGAEVAVTGLDGAHAHIRNDGTEVIYAAKTAGITAGADGVASIPAGQSDTIRGISGAVYLLGTGSVLIQSDDYVASPFKTSAASGGSAVDEVARAAINAHSGNADIHVTAEEKAAWNAVNYSNPNLLVNPDFKINQRGETAWSIGTTNIYFVDRWYSARTNLSLSDDGLMLAWNGTDGSDGWIQEKVETKALFGKTVTISVNANDKIYTITDTIPETVNATSHKAFTGTPLSISLTNHGGNTFAVVLHSTSTTPSLIRWIKCELGTIATPFTPPDPATELAKCQRYFYRTPAYNEASASTLGVGFIGGIDYAPVNITLPTTMRTNPTMTLNGTLSLATAGHNGKDGVIKVSNTTTGSHSTPNSVTMVFDISDTSDESIVGNCCLLQNRDGGYIDISAEL